MARLALIGSPACWLLLASLAASSQVAGAQTSVSASPPSFETASIKLNASGEPDGGSVFQPGGRYRAHNVRIRAVIAEAYQLRIYQVVSGPAWLDGDRVDIDAKAAGPEGTELIPQGPGAPAPARLPFLMLRRLLQERFNLVAHLEMREGRVYALTVARSDGRRGPALRQQQEPCSNNRELPAPPPGGFCDGIRRAPGRFVGTGATMRQLVGSLSTIVTAPVVDETKLAGTFNLTLEWTPIAPVSSDASANGAVDSSVSLFTALREQLGLRLSARRGPIETLIINRIEKPTVD